MRGKSRPYRENESSSKRPGIEKFDYTTALRSIATEPAIAMAGSAVGEPAAALPEVSAGADSAAVEVAGMLTLEDGVEEGENEDEDEADATEWRTVIVVVAVVVLVDVIVSSAATSWGAMSASAGRTAVMKRITAVFLFVCLFFFLAEPGIQGSSEQYCDRWS